MWEISAGRAYAIKHLEALYLPPARMLELTEQYSIESWVEPAVKSILAKKISNISLDDISRMGIHVYWILVRGKERFDIEVRRTANVEPYMGRDPTWQCENHSLCLKVWRKLWWTKIGRKLLHPDYPLTSDDILWEVKRLKQKGLTEACRNDMARQILIKEVTFCDERVVPAVAQAIVAYHKSL